MYIYLSVRNALPMIPLSQVKISYMPKFYRSPLKNLFSYYYTIFKLFFFFFFFQCDTSLCRHYIDGMGTLVIHKYGIIILNYSCL